MMFDNDEQKKIYQNHWFIPSTKKVIILCNDGLRYDMVADAAKQREHFNEKDEKIVY